MLLRMRLFLFQKHYAPVISSSARIVLQGGCMFCERVQPAVHAHPSQRTSRGAQAVVLPTVPPAPSDSLSFIVNVLCSAYLTNSICHLCVFRLKISCPSS
jgi:hypothetical protein